MPRGKIFAGLLLGAGVTSTLALSIVPVVAQDVVLAGAVRPATVTKQGQGAANPVQPAQPFGTGAQDVPTPSPIDTTTGGGASSDALAALGGGAAQPPRQEQTTASPGTQNVAATQETAAKASTDVGDFLAKSEQALGVEVQRRSPVVTDPTIRGRRAGQITTYLDGGWAYPARLDLDTIVSKIDSSLIRDVIVVKGPYNFRYGSGFTFLDIATTLPPRYECGFENHGHILSGYKTNGQQLRERAELYGGSSDFGYRVGYNLGVGNDYHVPESFIFNGVDLGNGIPSSYNTQSIDYAFGFDINRNNTLTLYGVNLVQRNLELPGMPFDFRRLESQSYSIRHELKDCCSVFDRLTTDAWYAYTHFTGDNGIRNNPNFNPNNPESGPPLLPLPGYGKRLFYYDPVSAPFEEGRGFFPNLAIAVNGGAMTTGFRQLVTWGSPKSFEFNLGWDFRYLSQRNDEYDFFTSDVGSTGFTNYPVPRSHQMNRGLFADSTAQVGESLIVKTGARMDVTNVDVDSFKQGLTENQIRQALGNDNLNNEYLLWNGYVSSEYKLSRETAILAGVGTGQRPASLTELYAISPYSAQIQRTFHFFRGNPGLAPEQALQIDTGFRSDFEWCRVGVSGYMCWIHNYITYQPLYNTLPPEVSEFTPNDGPVLPGNNRDSLEFRYINTDLALLSGFEAYGEVTLMPCLTTYASASYVRGTDLSRGDRVTPDQIAGGLFPSVPDSEPLPSIVPLETRLGIRIHETCPNPRWSVDFSARHVSEQERVAASLGEEPTGAFTVYDVRGYWQVNDRWSFNVGVENVFDKFYREHLDIRTGRGVFQPGRNYYVVAEMRF